jgi:hypothetical protein
LDVSDESVEVFLQSDHFLVESSSHLVFLGFLEDEVFNLDIKLFNSNDDLFGVSLDSLNLIKNILDFLFLALQV